MAMSNQTCFLMRISHAIESWLVRICFYDKMHYARKERFVMNSATIALTSEQKAIIAEKMGLVSDELVLTSLSSTQDVAQIEDIGENLFLAASKTFTVS